MFCFGFGLVCFVCLFVLFVICCSKYHFCDRNQSSASNLRQCFLNCNRLVDISNVDWQSLSLLSVLLCSGNFLEIVPASILNHSKLEVLYLGYNRLNRVESFPGCERLKILHLGGNPELNITGFVVSLEANPRLFHLILTGTQVNEDQIAAVADDFGDSLTIEIGKPENGTGKKEEKELMLFHIFSVGFAETIGLRSAMEDRSVEAQLKDGSRLYAIFDGHGGDICST